MDDQASGTGRVTGGSVHIGTDLRKVHIVPPRTYRGIELQKVKTL